VLLRDKVGRPWDLAVNEQTAKDLQWLILSFANKNDHQSRDAVIVHAYNIDDAVMICGLLGIKPGGDLQCISVTEELIRALPRWVLARQIKETELKEMIAAAGEEEN
jgi:hypothetical protein